MTVGDTFFAPLALRCDSVARRWHYSDGFNVMVTVLFSRQCILARIIFCDFERLENSVRDTEPQTNKHPTMESPAEAQRAEFSEANEIKT
jgi:hypothetical protein